jgi:hypothetical protein
MGIEEEDGYSSVCATAHLGDVVMGLSAELNIFFLGSRLKSQSCRSYWWAKK